MGLDSFWELPSGQKEIVFDPPLRLCGGMFSEHGQGSFRGKVYNEIIENISGVSLYVETMENDQVRVIADALQKTPYKDVSGDSDNISEDEFNDLKRMFGAYAEAGAKLRGWW